MKDDFQMVKIFEKIFICLVAIVTNILAND